MSKIYQLKIKLLNTKPLIWRRVQVRHTSTFWDLHVVIRDAMQWTDLQPHYFKIIDANNNEHIINSYLDNYNDNTLPLSWNIGIKKYLLNENNTIYYYYGIDENYVHKIILEKLLYRKINGQYPNCTHGKGITEEDSDEESETSTGQKIKSLQKFKSTDVTIHEGGHALLEHKLKLFDSLYY
jgi:hypothetical protein